MKPNYAPNTVNQTVDYGGIKWQGQPGGDWTQIGMTGQPNAADQRVQQEAVQTAYQSAIGTAVSNLQTAGTNLDTQYGDLLGKVLGQGTVAMNSATLGENNLLASRGITNNSPLYSAQMTQTQLPVTTQNQAAVSNLGYTQAGLKLGLAGQIAGLQAGAAGTSAQLPLQYGSLALAQAANVANIGLAGAQTQQAQTGARYITIPGVGVVDLTTGRYVGGVTNNNLNSGGYQILNVP